MSESPRRRPYRKPSGKRRPHEQQLSSAALAKPRPLCPDPSAPLPAVWVKSAVRHPLLYRRRVMRIDGARPGDLVAVYVQDDGSLLGYGLYNPRSEYAVRMIRYGEELPDEPFWKEQLHTAVSLRRELLKLDEVTNAYRVVHSEGDQLSGIVIDKYADVLSAEIFSLGMFQRAEELLQMLAPMCDATHTLVQTAPAVLSQEGFSSPPLASEGLPNQVTITEQGVRFRVRFQGGHKTGFFCDQRENRKKLAEFSQGKSVLDLCCYTGGFSVYAKALGNAEEVTGVDLDEEPLQLAKENANLNQVRVKFVQADAFAYMRDMLRGGKRYDVVVLDPPKLIRSRAEIEEGTRKHFDLNRLAMQLVAPGGLLLTCTCAGLLPEDEFMRLLYAAARQSGSPYTLPDGTTRHHERTMQVLAKAGAAADHPVASNCLETEYLNAAWVRLGA